MRSYELCEAGGALAAMIDLAMEFHCSCTNIIHNHLPDIPSRWHASGFGVPLAAFTTLFRSITVSSGTDGSPRKIPHIQLCYNQHSLFGFSTWDLNIAPGNHATFLGVS